MDKDLIRKRFSKASATYNREASAQKDIAGEMCALLEHIASRKDFSEVLEIGCGTGVYTGMIKSRFNPDKLYINDISVEFVRYKDNGDTYNFGPEKEDSGEYAKARNLSFQSGTIRDVWELKTDFFDVNIAYDKGTEFLKFKIQWDNKLKNRLWQVKFNLKEPVTHTLSEDMNTLIERTFEPTYDIRKNLPEKRGIEAKTNTAPMQRLVSSQGFSIMTKGLTEYEVCGKSLLLTLMRSVGVISNPKNSSRSTPAGPPLELKDAQLIGEYCAEFAVGFFDVEAYDKYINQYFLTEIL